jgi:lysophospholipase L1-like esterase
VPATGHERFPANKRWTGRLQQLLGDDYEIIEEGLNSRTLNSDDTRVGKEGRNGSTYVIPCLDTHDPIDLVILMLGTNELKDSFESNLEDILNSFENNYVKIISERESQFRGTTPKTIIKNNIDTRF